MAFEEIASGSFVATNKLEDGQIVEGYITGLSPNRFQPQKNDIQMVGVDGVKRLVIPCGFLNSFVVRLSKGEEPMGVLYRLVRDSSLDYTEKKFNKLVRGFKILKDTSETYENSMVKATDDVLDQIPV